MRSFVFLVLLSLVCLGCDGPSTNGPSPAKAVKQTNKKVDELLKQNEQRNQQIEEIADEAVSP